MTSDEYVAYIEREQSRHETEKLLPMTRGQGSVVIVLLSLLLAVITIFVFTVPLYHSH
jgi:hypothetical protein